MASQPDSRICFCLLGGFEILQNGVPLPRTRTRTEQWLLALLILNSPREVQRSWLAGTFWPESEEAQALGNLRRSLSNLRQVLGEESYRLLSPTPRTLAFELSRASCDLLEFDAALKRGDSLSLEQAVALYRGPLLPECEATWIVPEREARESALGTALETLAKQAIQNGNPQEAARLLRRILRADPYQETIQCTLMEALAACGDQAGVILAYRQFRLLLHEELNTDPAPQTKALYQRLRDEAKVGKSGESGPAPVHSRQVVSDAVRPHSLPWPVSDLVGRENETAEVVTLLLSSRLVTLTGTGGIGKTRLALTIAAKAAADFPDGVCFVDLAPLSDPAFVLQATAAKLGLREEPGRSLLDTLNDFLAAKRLLVVLDNCEHLLDACIHFATTLLQNGPWLRVLATSRQSLGITGEHVWRVPSLPVPEAQMLTHKSEPLIALMDYSGTRLFVERALEASSTFTLTERNAPAVLQICRRLDGIPLALELAAVRVKVLTVEQISARLEDAFHLLTGGNRAALPRHQTLRALLDWSYGLLSQPEKRLLNRLSVFAGGWTLEAAEAITSDKEELGGRKEEPDMIHPSDVLDLLTSLVDKSLVLTSDHADGTARYRLLETVRQYGRQKQQGEADEEALQRHHRDYYLAFALEANRHALGPEQALWMRLLEADHDNLRLALNYCLIQPDVALGEAETEGRQALRLAAALIRFWDVRGYMGEGREWFAAALKRSDAQAPTWERAEALNGAGVLAMMQSDYEAARACHEESLRIRHTLHDPEGTASSLGSLANTLHRQGNLEQARALNEQALALHRAAGNRNREASILNNLGLVAMESGEDSRACSLYEESLAISRVLGNHHLMALTLSNLAIILQKSDLQKAADYFQEALEIQQTLGDRSGIARTLSNLGNLHMGFGNAEKARTYLADCLTRYHALKDGHGIAYALVCLAMLALSQNQGERAVRIFGAEEALCQAIGALRPPLFQEVIDQALIELWGLLGKEGAEIGLAAGRAFTLEQAIEFALSETVKTAEETVTP